MPRSWLMKFFLNPETPRQIDHGPEWWRDPLTHPDISLMDARELADLPMPRLPVPAGDRVHPLQKNGVSRGGSAATSICSGGRPARARAAICS